MELSYNLFRNLASVLFMMLHHKRIDNLIIFSTKMWKQPHNSNRCNSGIKMVSYVLIFYLFERHNCPGILPNRKVPKYWKFFQFKTSQKWTPRQALFHQGVVEQFQNNYFGKHLGVAISVKLNFQTCLQYFTIETYSRPCKTFMIEIISQEAPSCEMFCAIWYYLYNSRSATFNKVSGFIKSDTKSRETHMCLKGASAQDQQTKRCWGILTKFHEHSFEIWHPLSLLIPII